MTFVFQIILILLLVLLNGYFVASEFSMVAVRKTRIEELSKKGNVTAKILNRALSDLDRYISATQLGITLASLALGWIGEPALAKFIEPLLTFLPHDTAFFTAHTLAVIIAFSIITFLHIVLGELAPKTIALQYSEKTSLVIITPLVIFSNIFRPFIWLLNGAGRLVLKGIGLKPAQEKATLYSENEISMLLRESGQGGIIPIGEVEIALNTFKLGDTQVKRILVPRREVIAFDTSLTIKEIIKKIKKNPHSRFPVYKKSIDNVIGFIHIKDLYLELLTTGENTPLSRVKILRKIITVPETKKIGLVLQEMRRRRKHVAIVVNEKGRTRGIVTLEDIIESLVGKIEDEFDE